MNEQRPDSPIYDDLDELNRRNARSTAPQGRALKDSILGKIATIRGRLQDHLQVAERKQVRGVDVARVIERPYSTVAVFTVRTTEGAESYIMKAVSHHPLIRATTSAANQALVEFDILTQLYGKFSKMEVCSVPRPVLVAPEIEAFVMELVEGSPLIDEGRYVRPLSSRARFARLVEYYKLAGRWLKRFHETTGLVTAGPEGVQGVLERCQQRLNLIRQAQSRLCPVDFCGTAARFIEEQVEKLDVVLLSGRHGDFGPWNILVSANRITVIDFMGFRQDALPIDLLKMLVYLEDERKALTSSGRRVGELRKGFLEGYGNLPTVSPALVAICEAMQRIVSVWSRISDQVRSPWRTLEHWRVIRTHASWFAGDGHQHSVWP